MRIECCVHGRAGDAHDETEIGDKAVIGAEHGGTQCIAAHAAVAAFDARQRCAGKTAARRAAGKRLDDAGMAALCLGQSAGHRVGLPVILPAVDMLERVDGGKDEFRAELPRQEGQHAGAQVRLQRRGRLAARADALAPELRVAFLHRGEALVDGLQFRILLGLGECAIKGRTVDLALQVGAVTAGRFRPLRTPRGVTARLTEAHAKASRC